MKNQSENNILKGKNLRIGYRSREKETTVASHVDLELKQGELTAVIGMNGVGKSTLLRSISGVQDLLEGEVIIKERNIKEIYPRELAELISLVLTEQPLSRNLEVLELIALGRQPYTNWLGTLTAYDREKVKEAVTQVGIEELQHKKCYELSDGQLQKALIARAIAQDTPLIILDEPTTHLDIYHQAYVLKLLSKLTQHTQKSILFSTHEINLALQLCDRIILMEQGKITTGTPGELMEREAFSNLFPSDLIYFDKSSGSFRIKT